MINKILIINYAITPEQNPYSTNYYNSWLSFLLLWSLG